MTLKINIWFEKDCFEKVTGDYEKQVNIKGLNCALLG